MRIALFGTFDVDNYGDLLFPYIAQGKHPEHHWTFVAPTNSKTAFIDSKPTKTIQEIKNEHFDLVVIGGGNIIHTKPTSLPVYQTQNVHSFAYPELWVGAAKFAIKRRIPYVFNAPSISNLFASSIEKFIFNAVLKNSSYVSFREQYSCEFAKQLNTSKEVHCVTDTAIEIAKYLPLPTKKRKNKIVINLNQRYHSPAKITAHFLDVLSSQLQLDIDIVVIGDCHGDINFSKSVKAKLKNTNTQFIEKQSIEQLAHRIGESQLFIGSSMHGFITALSYGTPALLVLNEKPMHKFVGLIENLAIDRRVICSNWCDVLERIEEAGLLPDYIKKGIAINQNQHWERITNTDKTQDIGFINSFIIHHWKALLTLDRRINKLRTLKSIFLNA